jgi:hypothetical protein
LTKRRDLWNAIASKSGLQPGSPEETTFIACTFSLSPNTFDSNLSRGFARRHIAAIRELCARNDLPFNADDWCAPGRDWTSQSAEQIGWVGRPLFGVEDFYERLETLYRSATDYRVLRVGGTYSRNRTRFEFGDDGLAVKPEGPSIRIPYLKAFWKGLRERRLYGTSVHVIRTVDRLVELWACLEMLRKLRLNERNFVYMAPIPAPGSPPEMPAVGMRVIDRSKTLLSLPAPVHGHSHYSSWIESERLAGFASEYIDRVRDIGDDLTKESPKALEAIVENAFMALKSTGSGNYGILADFDQVREIKARMLKWAEGRNWLPVIG